MESHRDHRSLGNVLFFLLVCCLVFFGSRESVAQEEPPKEFPKILRNYVEPDAFYAVDKNGFRVMLPGMTFEEIDRLRKAAAGFEQAAKQYTIEQIAVEGTADDVRAELAITMIINFPVSSETRIIVPLEMEGFHPQGPADVVGVEEYGFDFAAGSGGHLLWVRIDQPRRVEVRIRAVSRTSTTGGTGLEVKLPMAPAQLKLKVRGENLEASIVGRGDEIVETEGSESGQTAINVQCSGNDFTVNWRTRNENQPTDQVLEATSRLRLAWDDPQTPPTVVAELEVNNRRGKLVPFDVVLPAGAELIEPLQSSPSVQLMSRDSPRGTVVVSPADNEPLARLKFTLEYRLASGTYDASNPLLIQPPELPSAVRHAGEFEIRTDRNYRLRWLQNPAVRSARRPSGASDGAEPRIYFFQFDRAAFQLPIWLATKRQAVRIEPSYSVTIEELTATIVGKIVVSGPVEEGIPIGLVTAGWRTTAIEDLESGRDISEPMNSLSDNLELELDAFTPSANSEYGFRWTAERTFDGSERMVHFPLPQVTTIDPRNVILSPGRVQIRTTSGLSVIPDLTASQGIERLIVASRAPGTPDTPSADGLDFRLLSIDREASFHGYLVERPPEATFTSAAEFAVGPADQLRTKIVWNVSPRSDLRGQLPVRLPRSLRREASSEGGDALQWIVTVNGQVAVLRSAEENESVAADQILYSQELGSQPCQIEWTLLSRLASSITEPDPRRSDNRVPIILPVPALARSSDFKPIEIRSIEEAGLQLILRHQGNETIGPIDLLADSTIEALIRLRETSPEGTAVIDGALLRSEIGRQRRFDRLVAKVRRGSVVRIPLDAIVETANLSVPGFNGRNAILRIYVDNIESSAFSVSSEGIQLNLPNANQDHFIDIRLWQTRDDVGVTTTLRPAFQVPLSVGKISWDVVLAADRHLIWYSPLAASWMRWQFDRGMIYRVPLRSYDELLRGLGTAPPTESTAGNRYLLVSSDPASLEIYQASRVVLWMVVAGSVLIISWALLYLPALRSAWSLIFAACILAGLAWNAPDFAAILGQLVFYAMIFVAIMVGLKGILARRPRATVLGGMVEEPLPPSAESATAVPAPPEPGSGRIPEVISGSSAAGAPL